MQRNQLSFISVNTLANKACFYQAIMLDIIHDVLTDRIDEDSQTADALKTNLWNAISDQLKSCDFVYQSKTLKESIMSLLSLYCNKIPSSSSQSNDITYFIKHCNLKQLLNDVCVPALQELTITSMKHNKEIITPYLKKIMASEFAAFIKWKYQEELAFDKKLQEDKDGILAAHHRHFGGEFFGIEEKLKNWFLDSWKKQYKENKDTFDPHHRDQWLESLFEEWWQDNQDNAYRIYTDCHSEKVWAGTPQQVALGQILKCNINLVGSKDEIVTPSAKPRETWQNLYIVQNNDHFKSMLHHDSQIALELKTVAEKMLAKEKEIDQVIQEIKSKTSEIQEKSKLIKNNKNINLSDYEQEILTAAEGGYKNALKQTTFGRTMKDNHVFETLLMNIDENNLTDTDKDFLLAVNEQNQEILKTFSKK